MSNSTNREIISGLVVQAILKTCICAKFEKKEIRTMAL